MKFPAANVSIKNWDKNEDYVIYILEDEFIYTTDNELFHKYFLNKLFVDSNGEIYKLIDRKLPSTLRQVLSFLPNFCKVALLFKNTGEKMTLEQVREHILNQINKLDNDQNKVDWVNIVKDAETFEDIIFG